MATRKKRRKDGTLRPTIVRRRQKLRQGKRQEWLAQFVPGARKSFFAHTDLTQALYLKRFAHENGDQCEECQGRGFHVGQVCCGDLDHGDCRTDCSIPEQVDCLDCGGSGVIPMMREAAAARLEEMATGWGWRKLRTRDGLVVAIAPQKVSLPAGQGTDMVEAPLNDVEILEVAEGES